MGALARGLLAPLRAAGLASILEEDAPTLGEDWRQTLERAAQALLTLAYLQGASDVLDSAPDDVFADVPVAFEELTFEEAIAALRARVPLSAAAFRELEDALQVRAFTVARLAEKDLVARVRRHIAATMEEGESVAGFIRRVGSDEVLSSAGFAEEAPHYLENVLRTNQSAAYSAGRWSQFDALEAQIEALVYVAIDDRRTTQICRGLDGLTRPARDAVWETRTPPNHFQCRSALRAVWIGTAEAEALSVTPGDAPVPRAGAGFRSSTRQPRDLTRLTDSQRQRAKEYGILDDLRRAGAD